MKSRCLVLSVQSGNWASGTPGWLPAARIFLLGSIVFGYLFSAALYLLSARLISGDKRKLETVMQSGSLDAVSANFWFCYCPSMPWFWHQRTHETVVGIGIFSGGRLCNAALGKMESRCPAGRKGAESLT